MKAAQLIVLVGLLRKKLPKTSISHQKSKKDIKFLMIEENIRPYYIDQPDYRLVHKLLLSNHFHKIADFDSNRWDKTSLYVKRYLL